jgi:hypothetical protein
MIEPATTPEGIPIIVADPFSLENIAEPHGLHEQLREAGPLVHLDYYGIWRMARYEQVNAALKDWETFGRRCRGLSNFRKEKPWRTPSLLLEAEPGTSGTKSITRTIRTRGCRAGGPTCHSEPFRCCQPIGRGVFAQGVR